MDHVKKDCFKGEGGMKKKLKNGLLVIETNTRSDEKSLHLMSSVTLFFRAGLSEKKKWNSWGEGVFLDPGEG